jgi:hypothetical protein
LALAGVDRRQTCPPPASAPPVIENALDAAEQAELSILPALMLRSQQSRAAKLVSSESGWVQLAPDGGCYGRERGRTPKQRAILPL